MVSRLLQACIPVLVIVIMSGCSYLRGVFYPDYQTQRYKTHVYIKHGKPDIKDSALQSDGTVVPYTDHPDLFVDASKSIPADGLVDISAIARPATESAQKVSPLITRLGERGQQALVQSFSRLQGDQKKFAEFLQILLKDQISQETKPEGPTFSLEQKVEFDIATTLNTGLDADRLEYVTTYIALDDQSADAFSFLDIQDIEREVQELIIGEITKSIVGAGKLAIQGAPTQVGTSSGDISSSVTETFKKNFIQRFMGRTVSIDGKRKYFRVTQRGTQEHPVEGLKRYFVTLAIKADSTVKDAVFSPVWDATSATGLKGVTRRHLDVPKRTRADGVAVTVAVVRKLVDGDNTRVEFDDNVEGIVVLKRQIIKGIWRYPLTLYGLRMTEANCWNVTNVVPELQAQRTTGEVEPIFFAGFSEAISFSAFIAKSAQQPGSSVELKELDRDGKEMQSKYIFGFGEGPGRVSFGRIPQARRTACLNSLKPLIHRSAE